MKLSCKHRHHLTFIRLRNQTRVLGPHASTDKLDDGVTGQVKGDIRLIRRREYSSVRLLRDVFVIPLT